MEPFWIIHTFCFLLMFWGCCGNHTVGVSLNLHEEGRVITEGTVRMFQANITLFPTPAQHSNLFLGICVTIEDADIATTALPYSEQFDLTQEHLSQFNFSVTGLFLGRTHLLLSYYFSVSNANSFLCGRSLENVDVFSESGDSFNLTVPSNNLNKQLTSVELSSHHEIVVVREERAIDTIFTVVVICLVGVVNLGMGCKIDLSVVMATLRRPIAPVTGFLSQFIIMPLVSYGAVKVFQFDSALALGFFALGCSPGGSASNAYCLLLDGDVSLSITMTLISTLAALGMVPLWMFSLGRMLYSDNDFTIPYQNMLYSLGGLLIPVGIGIFIQRTRPKLARFMVTFSKVVMVVFLVFVLSVGVYANIYIFQLMTMKVLFTAALLPYVGFTLGGLVALALRMPRRHILTIAIETGIQNTGIAIVLLLLSLDHPESDISIVAPIASALFTPIPLWVAIAVLYIRRRFCQKSSAPFPLDDGDHQDSPQSTNELVQAQPNGHVDFLADRDVNKTDSVSKPLVKDKSDVSF